MLFHPESGLSGVLFNRVRPGVYACLKKLIRERFGDDFPIDYVVCNPTAGSHAGPNGVGVCFHAMHR